jgi:hypothetical protein
MIESTKLASVTFLEAFDFIYFFYIKRSIPNGTSGMEIAEMFEKLINNLSCSIKNFHFLGGFAFFPAGGKRGVQRQYIASIG